MRLSSKASFAIALLALQVSNTLQERGSKADQDACTPDVFRLCAGNIPNEAAILACLQGKKTDLSPACAKVLFSDDATAPRKPKVSN